MALVNGARHLGFKFICKDEESNLVIDSWGTEEKYELLNVFQFDSDRKRMSVIVRTPEDKIMVVCKGADSIMEKRLAPGQEDLLGKTQEYLDEYAKTGLRTLLVGQKQIDPDFYHEWAKRYVKAATATVNRDKEMAAVQDEVEIDFELLGSTAIEDKLQVDVG